jgi:hypothetical protein
MQVRREVRVDLVCRVLGNLVGCLLRWGVRPPGSVHRTLTT